MFDKNKRSGFSLASFCPEIMQITSQLWILFSFFILNWTQQRLSNQSTDHCVKPFDFLLYIMISFSHHKALSNIQSFRIWRSTLHHVCALPDLPVHSGQSINSCNKPKWKKISAFSLPTCNHNKIFIYSFACNLVSYNGECVKINWPDRIKVR